MRTCTLRWRWLRYEPSTFARGASCRSHQARQLLGQLLDWLDLSVAPKKCFQSVHLLPLLYTHQRPATPEPYRRTDHTQIYYDVFTTETLGFIADIWPRMVGKYCTDSTKSLRRALRPILASSVDANFEFGRHPEAC